MQRIAEAMMEEAGRLVKRLLQEAQEVRDPRGAELLERSVRRQGQDFLRVLLERLLQGVLERQDQARSCPRCGGRRRHKGVRVRGVISSVGAIRLSGPYWYCRQCRRGEHCLDALVPESVSGVLKELLCLLGASLASFSKAGRADEKLLGVRISSETIWRLCRREGQKAVTHPAAPHEVSEQADLIGSCDGTMVNTRQCAWKELKAYQYSYDGQRYGQAHLESSRRFLPRIRRAAVKIKAGKAGQIFWVSDAAEWIDKGIAKQRPTAVRIVDIWHAYQHVHEASRKIFGEGTAKAKQWAKKYCDELRGYGGWTVWNSLRPVRYKDPERQEALEALLTFVRRNADRMDYPRYERRGWPISSGPMESFCKQLGLRLKGPGMRWSIGNVSPMAALVSLWTNEQWDTYWHPAA